MLLALQWLSLLGFADGSAAAQRPVAELKRLADIDLRPSSPWLDLAAVGDWVPFGDGVATLTWHGTLTEFEFYLHVYDGDGKLLHEVRLPSRERAPSGVDAQRAWTPGRICALGERELGVLPAPGSEQESVGRRVDLDHEALSPWPIPVEIGFYSYEEPLPGGDFLELALQPSDRMPSLRRLAANRTVRWKLDRESGFSADGGMALASDGRILAWNAQDPPAIQVVSPEGRVVRTELLKELVPEAGMIRGVAAGAHGELYVDIDELQGRQIVHLDASLKLLGAFAPHFPNGSKGYGSFHCAPDGRLWIHDGFCFARLSADGATERILGPAPGAPVLQSAHTVHITNDGRVFAESMRDGRLFELDAAGRVLQVYEPSEQSPPFRFEDFEWQMAPPELATRYRWHSFDEGRRLWRVKSTRALLLRADESELLGVTLLPVQLSEAEARPLAVSRAGLFAVQISATGIRELRVLDPEGKIRVVIPLDARPIRFVSLDDQQVAITTANTVELYDMRGSFIGHADLPPDGRSEIPGCGNVPDLLWRVDLRRDAKELWLRQGPSTLIVRRYALP